MNSYNVNQELLKMILDCSSPAATKKSLSEIFNTTERKLITLLRSVKPYDNNFQRPEDAIYNQISEQFGEPASPLKITWFHGTRTEDQNSFITHGILPKTAARNIIEPRLNELAVGLEYSGEQPFAMSIAAKQNVHDEGPFAVLIKDIAIHAPEAHHSYVEAPEIVEDIAGSLLGENYTQLVARYQKTTTPCIVSFTADSKGYEIPYALWYLKLMEDGDSEIDAADTANTCFDGEGITITPDQIKDVEQISVA